SFDAGLNISKSGNYTNLCTGSYFNFTPLHNYNHFCDFIEFKHPNMIMNTSQYTCSSW
ncbi:non-LEE encoded effector protein NleB, partial [Escherichia coli]|nr:non-LEE encoded effector protein NleB [Escherichia coli]MEC4950797.1 non-LEE encoded effector protein NleB [Escherichia coli]MEC4966392.1 non-LEE encoded effector protein NleB [Escherichia coli]MEC5007128.1 non-LEE encoded effector protein NleB [Escherichia coli]MEC5017544.1 non-LEE encoded effector protein NleB [Escherichia coli]